MPLVRKGLSLDRRAGGGHRLKASAGGGYFLSVSNLLRRHLLRCGHLRGSGTLGGADRVLGGLLLALGGLGHHFDSGARGGALCKPGELRKFGLVLTDVADEVQRVVIRRHQAPRASSASMSAPMAAIIGWTRGLTSRLSADRSAGACIVRS